MSGHMSRLMLPLLALVASAVPSPAAHAQLSTAEVARRATPATVVVLALDQRGDTIGSGSGFIVDAGGTITRLAPS